MPLREPLCFTPQAYEKVWGGERLRRFVGPRAPGCGPLGEVWTLADRPGVRCEVLEGRFQGRSLSELMLSERKALLGDLAERHERFPLLVKLLDTNQNLSIQVHPDARAAELLGGGAESKTECWYVLAAEANAQVYLGLKPDVEAARFAACAGSHAVVDLLRTWPVQAGDFVFVPPGTVHAIGAGVTLLELQNNSDTTYRLYDWERLGLDGKPRATQLDAALRSIDYLGRRTAPAPAATSVNRNAAPASLLDEKAFRVQYQELGASSRATTGARPLVYVVLSGEIKLSARQASTSWRMRPWQTWLMPADLGEHTLEPAAGEARLLIAEPRNG